MDLAKGSLCLLMAEALRHLIVQGARQRELQGQGELAADALRMLWSPSLLVAIGGGLLLRGLLLAAAAGLRQGLRRSARHRPRAAHLPVSANPRHPGDQDAPHLQALRELGLAPDSTWEAIRSHWRRHVVLWHPDRGGDVELWHVRLAAYQRLRAREQARSRASGGEWR